VANFERSSSPGKGVQFVVQNSCPYTIWPEVTYRQWPDSSDTSVYSFPELAANSGPFTWSENPYWMTSARMWAKEGCDGDGRNCAIDAGNSPTLFEWTIYPNALDSCRADINYDISLGA
jgi:hypothetical protein